MRITRNLRAAWWRLAPAAQDRILNWTVAVVSGLALGAMAGSGF